MAQMILATSSNVPVNWPIDFPALIRTMKQLAQPTVEPCRPIFRTLRPLATVEKITCLLC